MRHVLPLTVLTFVLAAAGVAPALLSAFASQPMPTGVQPTLAASDARPPVVAGMFYPDDPDELARMVDGFLNAVEPVDGEPAVLIVPHAGYVYSGPVAAYSYRQIQGVQYDTVVVVGNNHRDPTFQDISVWTRGAWQTPLGEVPIDEELAAELLEMSEHIVDDPTPHLAEHSIEVQLPFLQRVCPDCAIVPVLIGRPTRENIDALSEALGQVLDGKSKKTLVVASTDLSHYPAYSDALVVDSTTLLAVETMDPDQVINTIALLMSLDVPNLGTCACGEGPLLVAIKAARLLGAEDVRILRYANSGDVPGGDRSQVVGYGAVMFWHWEPPALTEADREALLSLARESIAASLAGDELPTPPADTPALQRRSSVFVTLRQAGELRGCIGDLSASLPLGATAQYAALAAAFEDPRFPPLSAEELNEVKIEISVLSPTRRVMDPEAPGAIEVGVHGLVIRAGDRSGVLLPQVATEEGWNRQQFLEGVCRKAGLPDDAWQEGALLYTFTVQVFGEEAD